MPRSDDPALHLFELNLRIQALQAALDGPMSFTPEERRDLEATIAALNAQAEVLQEEIRNTPGAPGGAK